MLLIIRLQPLLLVFVVVLSITTTLITAKNNNQNDDISITTNLVLPPPDQDLQKIIDQIYYEKMDEENQLDNFHDPHMNHQREIHVCHHASEFREVVRQLREKEENVRLDFHKTLYEDMIANEQEYRRLQREKKKNEKNKNSNSKGRATKNVLNQEMSLGMPSNSVYRRSQIEVRKMLKQKSNQLWNAGYYQYFVASGQFWVDLFAYFVERVEEHVDGKINVLGWFTWHQLRLDRISLILFQSISLIMVTLCVGRFFDVDTGIRVDFKARRRSENVTDKNNTVATPYSFTRNVNLFLNNTHFHQVSKTRSLIATLLSLAWLFQVTIFAFAVYDNKGTIASYSGLSFLAGLIPFFPSSLILSSMNMILLPFVVYKLLPAFCELVLWRGFVVEFLWKGVLLSLVSFVGGGRGVSNFIRRRKFLMEKTRDSDTIVVPDVNRYESDENCLDEKNNNFHEVYERIKQES